MRDQHRRPDPVDERRTRIGQDAGIIGAGIRRDRAEELIHRGRRWVDLDAREEIRPLAKAELIEEQLVVGRRRNLGGDGAVACTAPARLVDHIGRIALAQEQRLKPLAPVRGGFPAAARLIGAVPEDQRQRARVLWRLIEGVKVIAVEALPGLGRGVVVIGAGGLKGGPAGGEAALVHNGQRLERRSGQRECGQD